MSVEPTIRLAQAADAKVIHALVESLAQDLGQQHKFASQVADFLKFGFSDPPHFEALLAEQGGAAIGLSLFFYNFSTWRGELGVYVQDLVVDRGARTHGIGRDLLRATARHAQAHGATHLRLSVERDNAEAISFYERIGLEESCGESIFEAADESFRNLASTS